MNVPGANTIATAEHTMALLLALCRQVPQADAAVRVGEWKRSGFTGVQLLRKTLGIVGLGYVGAHVAQRARAFGMEVIAFDPFIDDEVARELTQQPDLTTGPHKRAEARGSERAVELERRAVDREHAGIRPPNPLRPQHRAAGRRERAARDRSAKCLKVHRPRSRQTAHDRNRAGISR